MRTRTAVVTAGLAGFLLGFLAAVIWLRAEPAAQPTRLLASGPPAPPSSQSAAPPALAASERPERTTVPSADRSPEPPEAGASSDQDGPSGLLFGSLLDPSGAPIGDVWYASVGFTDRLGRLRHADAKSGVYAISGLPSGAYTVSVHAMGYVPLDTSLELDASGPLVRRDFTLQKAVVLRIKALAPDGKPFQQAVREANAPVNALDLVPVATTDDPGKSFFEVFGSKNNPFGVGLFWDYGPEVAKLPPGYMGLLYLRCQLPVNVSLVMGHAVLQTQRVLPGTEEVVFVIPLELAIASLASIRVQVLDADARSPLEGAVLSFGVNGPSAGEGRTDSKGVATVEGVCPGKLDLMLGMEGYERYRKTVEVRRGGNDFGVIALEREVALEVRFVDPSGAGVAVACSIGVLDPATREIEMERDFGYKSDASGVLKIRGLGRRIHVLRTTRTRGLEAGWTSGNVLVDTRSGSIAPLVIRVKPAGLLVLSVTGASPDGLRFRVSDEQGLTIASGRFDGPAAVPLELPPGDYRITLLDSDGRELAQRAATLGSGTLEVAFPR